MTLSVRSWRMSLSVSKQTPRCSRNIKAKSKHIISVALRPSGAELFISDRKTSVSHFVNKPKSNLFYVP